MKAAPLTRVAPLSVWLLTLLGLALRLARWDFQPLWWDEGYSVWFAMHPLAEMAALTAQDIHPPLYYALLHGWTLVLGTGPLALRLFSVAAGVLAVPAIYAAGSRLFGRRTGVLAALLLALNPFHIFYSQEIRMYGLVALLATVTLWAAWHALQAIDTGTQAGLTPHGPATGSGSPATQRAGGAWVGKSLLYVLLAAAALYTQYYAAFLPLGLTLYGLWRFRRQGRSALKWLGAQVAVAVLYLPWLFYATPRLVPYVSQKVVQDADRPLGIILYLARHIATYLAGHRAGLLADYWPLALLLIVPLGLGLLWALGAKPPAAGQPGAEHPARWLDIGLKPNGADGGGPGQPAAMLATVLVTALLAGFAVNTRFPFFPDNGERLLLLGLPAFLLLAAIALQALLEHARPLGTTTLALLAGVSAVGLAGFYTIPRYQADDYRPLIARTVEQGLPTDTVFCIYPWQAGYWRAYGSPHGPQAVLTPSTEWDPVLAGALSAALDRGHLWFPAHLSLGGILETRIEGYLGEHAQTFANEWYGPGTRLSGWYASPEAVGRRVAPPLEFTLPGAPTPAVILASVAAGIAPAPAGNEVLPLALQWIAPARPPDLDVSVRLVDDLGQLWAQHDYEPAGSLAAGAPLSPTAATAAWQADDHLGLLIPAGTPPGDYSVDLVVSSTESGRTLEVRRDSSTPPTLSGRLFRVAVIPPREALGPERLPVAVRRPVDLGDGLRFLGYSTVDGALQPGEQRRVSLFWQATAAPANEYNLFLQLLDASGRMVAGAPEAPPGAGWPTNRWSAGTLMRSQVSLRAPAELPDGSYRMIAGLYNTRDRSRLVTLDGQDRLELGSLTIASRPRQMTPPRPAHVQVVKFGDKAELIGYDLPAAGVQAAPGGSVQVTLYWRALGATDVPYTAFVHLVSDDGRVAGYGDAEPGGGTLPTTGWAAGEYLIDAHTVVVTPGAAPGSYTLVAGLYDPSTGFRLSTPDGADQVRLGELVELRTP